MSQSLKVTGIKTSVYKKGQNLAEFVASHLRESGLPLEGSVIAITSKIVSIAENQLVPKNSINKIDLIKKESDHFLAIAAYDVCLTIKSGIVIPSAGIDESNSENGDYILYPKDAYASAHRLWLDLKKILGLKNFGLLITDSHTHPLRRGVTGIALSHWGFKATKNLVGQKDLFGRELRFTSVNVIDALSVAAVYMMGEVDERRPLAVIENPSVEFCDVIDPKEIQIEPQNDLYYPLLKDHLKP